MLTQQRTIPYSGRIEDMEFTPYDEAIEGQGGIPNYASFTIPSVVSSSLKIFERISGRTRGNRKKRDWKNFEHFKSVCNPPETGFTLPVYVSDGLWVYQGIMNGVYVDYAEDYGGGDVDAEPFGDAGMLDRNLPPFVESGPDGDYIPSPDKLDEMVSHALKHMLPYIKEQLSLVNSLIELKDFKSLPNTIRSLVDFTRKFFKRTGRKTLKDGVRLSADSYLQDKFNIEPLISDIMGIYNSLVGLEKRINDLLSRAGRPQTRHYAFRWVEFPNVVDELGSPYVVYGTQNSEFTVGPAVTYRKVRNVRYAPSTFHAEIEYNFNYTRYQVEHARLLATLDGLGVKLNPSIIWNAIPWSFVVDWVLRVGDYLDNFQVSNMEPQINILRFLWSVRRSRQIIVSRGLNEAISGDFVVPSLGTQYHYPSVQQTCYKRVSELPSSNSIESSGLSSKEFTLASALVLSRKRKYHKRRK